MKKIFLVVAVVVSSVSDLFVCLLANDESQMTKENGAKQNKKSKHGESGDLT